MKTLQQERKDIWQAKTIWQKILFPFELALFWIVVKLTALRMKLDKNYQGW